MELTEQAKEARRLYQAKWRAKNPHKQAEYMANYWEKKAKEMATAEQHICLYCGNHFEPKRSDAKFCSDRCRVAYNRNA
ncbi:MAG TPA: hypothetical protein ENN24_06265 [Bacteroidetes bacterium]|nr:hypothetical protein [Bacteroidota bacterium]